MFILDDKFKWNHHTIYVANRLSKLNGVLYLCRNRISSKALKTIYNALAYSHISYCITIWGGTWKKFINQVIIAQKRIVRTLAYATRYERSAPLFIRNRILSFQYVYTYFSALAIHKFIYSGYCLGIFQRNHAQRELRFNMTTVNIPLFRTTRGQQSIYYRAPQIWNNLSNDLRSRSNIVTFKRSLKFYLHNSQIQDVNENL